MNPYSFLTRQKPNKMHHCELSCKCIFVKWKKSQLWQKMEMLLWHVSPGYCIDTALYIAEVIIIFHATFPLGDNNCTLMHLEIILSGKKISGFFITLLLSNSKPFMNKNSFWIILFRPYDWTKIIKMQQCVLSIQYWCSAHKMGLQAW